MKEKPCQHCGTMIEPCQADVSDVLGEGAICGEWECALSSHLLTECKYEAGIRYRAGIAARKVRNEKEGK